VILIGSGCRSTTSKAVPESSRNLRCIRDAYLKATEKLERPPANLQELMPFLKEEGEPDQILRSPEDGQDYVIHWGADANANPAVVLAYEKQGKDGRRYVLWGPIVWFLSDEELKQKPFPPEHPCPL
jgi:hypothetical protein